MAPKAQNIETMQHNEHATSNALLEIEKILVLKSVPMFAETPESILSGISEIMREQRIEANVPIFKEGELGDCLYIIYEGSVSIHNDKQELAKMGSRDIFGELALLDPEPRSASATTLTDCMFLRIDKDDFDELMESRPEIMQGIISILAKRIRGQNKMIRELSIKTQKIEAPTK
jgi:CRP-like cAMP-binding protein